MEIQRLAQYGQISPLKGKSPGTEDVEHQLQGFLGNQHECGKISKPDQYPT